MIYKHKLILLVSITGALALLYTASFVFTPERTNKRSAYYTWLDQKSFSMVNRFEIITNNYEIEFLKKEQTWFVMYNGIEYPARDMRVEDFLNIFTKRDAWPVRSNSVSTHASFGLSLEQAERVKLYNGNLVILDILVGYDHVSGNEVSVRRYMQDEVRSGDNKIKTYVSSPVQSWFNLKLFSENENAQRVTVIKDDGEKQIFSLSNRQWSLNAANSDSSSIENYINIILSTEGDNFEGILTDKNDFNVSAVVTAEFGNGKIEMVSFSEPDESGRRLAFVHSEQGPEYVYSIPAWAGMRMFRNSHEFKLQ